MAEVVWIGVVSVQRISRAHGLTPHRMRSLKLSKDPRFLEKPSLPEFDDALSHFRPSRGKAGVFPGSRHLEERYQRDLVIARRRWPRAGNRTSPTTALSRGCVKTRPPPPAYNKVRHSRAEGAKRPQTREPSRATLYAAFSRGCVQVRAAGFPGLQRAGARFRPGMTDKKGECVDLTGFHTPSADSGHRTQSCPEDIAPPAAVRRRRSSITAAAAPGGPPARAWRRT